MQRLEHRLLAHLEIAERLQFSGRIGHHRRISGQEFGERGFRILVAAADMPEAGMAVVDGAVIICLAAGFRRMASVAGQHREVVAQHVVGDGHPRPAEIPVGHVGAATDEARWNIVAAVVVDVRRKRVGLTDQAEIGRIADRRHDQSLAARIEVEFAQLPGKAEAFIGAQPREGAGPGRAVEIAGDAFERFIVGRAERQPSQRVPAFGPGLDLFAAGRGQGVFENQGEGQRRCLVEILRSAEVEGREYQPRLAGIGDGVVPGDDAEIGPIDDRKQAKRRVGEVGRPGFERIGAVFRHPGAGDLVGDRRACVHGKSIDAGRALPGAKPALNTLAGVIAWRHRRHQMSERPGAIRAGGPRIIDHREVGHQQFLADCNVRRRLEAAVFGMRRARYRETRQ